MTTEEMRKWIDEAPYEALLRRWRFEPSGSPWFQGETGKYYSEVLFRRREEIGPEKHTAASKTIGWEKP